MLRSIYIAAVAAVEFFPKHFFSWSTEPFTAKQLDAASTWLGNFLYPDLKISTADIKAITHKELYDTARGSIGLCITDDDARISVSFFRYQGNGSRSPRLEIDVSYLDPDSEWTKRKVMFLTHDGRITVFDRTYNPEKKASEDTNHAVIFGGPAVSPGLSL